ncbi:helix-hairpin-helix domain pair protein [Geotalea daltonii FRC-32]|uniref:Helix-hairpin-helix domain pair protein n=1 Tax=Geotalea daltonii (strain DSM 22248 / JCM 15807 / FRC-32) TaxID=316067 RepID=B9M2A0_GEODF|nr:helix-hairpin-helix domain-containing protein [Geotalea daltonii]ACM21218.1 helix-hairpin-helix domain pair protein [Geotalea daltonii FRC-32]
MSCYRSLMSALIVLVVLSFTHVASAKVLRTYQGKLNINTASAADFARLPGIGNVIGFHIIKEREQLGRFSAIKDITSVKGIKPRVFETIKGHLTLTGENNLQVRIDLNTITKPVLLGLPGMSAGEARSIINFRKNRPFTSVEDLLLVPGINGKRMRELSEWLTVVKTQRR